VNSSAPNNSCHQPFSRNRSFCPSFGCYSDTLQYKTSCLRASRKAHGWMEILHPFLNCLSPSQMTNLRSSFQQLYLADFLIGSRQMQDFYTRTAVTCSEMEKRKGRGPVPRTANQSNRAKISYIVTYRWW
jgi:hypothetical protein